jgi:hypothetical protein
MLGTPLSLSNENSTVKRLVPYLSLLASFGTLLCCALPALFVSVGLGATVAASVSTFPQLIWLSENKEIVFGVAGAVLAASVLLVMNSRRTACPVDPELGRACATGRSFSMIAVIFSAILYLVGGFFAFIAPLLMAEG